MNDATDVTAETPAEPAGFHSLSLPAPLLRALAEVGYETPSPIQAETIPHLLGGRDVLGQAQTGTGKTAAFALPILATLEPGQAAPQALVLTPTRELAIQVSEAFRRYAKHVAGFRVLPIYGGQSYGPQLAALSRGVHVVVGTPGRLLDHIERGSLDLSKIRHLVLDEADEMLRMGFIDDVEAILGRTPASRQTALFSATLPGPIRRIASTHLRDPIAITIAARTRTAANIRQRFLVVSGAQKLDALTRVLEAEPFDAMIVFTRTKIATEELAERLQARGLAAAAINGDMPQAQRERTIAQLRDGAIDVLVATDVAARGLDVDRISHVLNFDVPHDTEAYVHRIGRTGRAGRSGEAILFVTPRERTLLRAIEGATRQAIERMELPSVEAVNDARIGRFKQQIAAAVAAGDYAPFQRVIEEFERESNVPAIEIAAALARLARGDLPLLLEAPTRPPEHERHERHERQDRREGQDRPERQDRPEHGPRRVVAGLEPYRIEVGHVHGVRPGNIVGAIANEAGLSASQIGRIEIFAEHSLIDLPGDLPPEVLSHLARVWCAGQQLRIRRDDGAVGGLRRERPEGPAPGRRLDRRAFAGARRFKARKRDPGGS